MVFSLMYHPMLPSIPGMMSYGGDVESDPRLKEIIYEAYDAPREAHQTLAVLVP